MHQNLAQSQPISPPSSAFQRQTIHDLRNLFGIVCSAKHLLEGQPAKLRRLALLQAIETAAIRGGELTTTLLAPPPQRAATRPLDLNHQITALEAMIGALTQSVEFDLCDEFLALRVDPDAMDAAIFELLANAKAAGATAITIRTRRKGARVWLTIADNGCGMDQPKLATARQCLDRQAEHGAGLCRVQAFARSAHAQFHLRSRCGFGTVVSMNLPTVLRVAASKPGCGSSAQTPDGQGDVA
jgi:K+-sensing histidine kinase KdpD